ncbi:MAG: NAD(P)-dependent oxidoreductase [Spirochaetes bacterium]|nr:NAD(P)-dependent oxidoreductase [Spirochaetota bacterium]
MSLRNVLVTGARGLVGGIVYRRLCEFPEHYSMYALDRSRTPSDRVPADIPLEIPADRFIEADIADFAAVRTAVVGMDTVLHLAAIPTGGLGWEAVLTSNITGAYNVFEACKASGVRRVVFASSIMVSWGVARDARRTARKRGLSADDVSVPMVRHDMPTRPIDIYSSSKVWGEALARTYSERGMSCICIRIGTVVTDDRPPEDATTTWCSHRDIADLFQRAVDAPDSLQFDIFYGVSDNHGRWVDIDHAREILGFVPSDRAEDII